MTFKQKIFNHCIQLVNDNIRSLQNNLVELTEGAQNDSKSSAGDKHETSISMMQIEQEKIRKQLNEALENKAILEKIDISTVSQNVIKGSLIKTNSMYLFISIALGKISIDNQSIIVLSPASPLGMQLMSKVQKDTAEMNGVKYFIEKLE